MKTRYNSTRYLVDEKKVLGKVHNIFIWCLATQFRLGDLESAPCAATAAPEHKHKIQF